MQHTGVFQLAQLLAGEAHLAQRTLGDAVDRLGQRHRQGGHAARVAGGGRIARLDGGHGSVDEAFEQAPDFVVEDGVLQRDAGLRGERLQHFLVARLKGNHARVEVGRRAQLLARLALLVDELDDANGVALGGNHGHGQHRARLVPGLLIEAAVVAQARKVGGGDGAEVGNVDGPAMKHRPAGHRFLVHGQRELLKIHGHRIVVREHEAQEGSLAFTVRGQTATAALVAAIAMEGGFGLFVRGFEHVHAARVGAADLSALEQNQVEQLADVALGSEGARNGQKFVAFIAGARGRLLSFRRLFPRSHGRAFCRWLLIGTRRRGPEGLGFRCLAFVGADDLGN